MAGLEIANDVVFSKSGKLKMETSFDEVVIINDSVPLSDSRQLEVIVPPCRI